MGKDYDNTNRGSLYGNDHKREGKKDPDLRGKIDINGTEFWLSAWFFTYEKEGEKRRGISLSIGDKVEPKTDKPKGKFDDLEDDIPW